MIIRRSSRNQVAIPKKLLDQAGLGKDEVFFDVRYAAGCFILKPLVFEEKIPTEAMERFKRRALKREPDDRIFGSMEELIAALDRPPKHR